MRGTKGNTGRSKAESHEAIQPLNHEQQRIIEWLKKVRFKKRFFGGVHERDVWKKIEQLNSMYDLALRAERARYDALLEEQRVRVHEYKAEADHDGRERERS